MPSQSVNLKCPDMTHISAHISAVWPLRACTHAQSVSQSSCKGSTGWFISSHWKQPLSSLHISVKVPAPETASTVGMWPSYLQVSAKPSRTPIFVCSKTTTEQYPASESSQAFTLHYDAKYSSAESSLQSSLSQPALCCFSNQNIISASVSLVF